MKLLPALLDLALAWLTHPTESERVQLLQRRILDLEAELADARVIDAVRLRTLKDWERAGMN